MRNGKHPLPEKYVLGLKILENTINSRRNPKIIQKHISKTLTMKAFTQIHRQPHPLKPPKCPKHYCCCLHRGCLSVQSHGVAAAPVIQIILLGKMKRRLRCIDPTHTRDGPCNRAIWSALGVLLFWCVHSLQTRLYRYGVTSQMSLQKNSCLSTIIPGPTSNPYIPRPLYIFCCNYLTNVYSSPCKLFSPLLIRITLQASAVVSGQQTLDEAVFYSAVQ